jgi:hypothetical protein
MIFIMINDKNTHGRVLALVVISIVFYSRASVLFNKTGNEKSANYRR